jgi:MFS family permease
MLRGTEPAHFVSAKGALDPMSIIQRLRANPWVVLVVLCLGLFMALLDTTIVNVAVPSIIEGIDASFDEILWVLNAYVLVFAALLITSGRLGDIFGPKRLFLAGMALFTVASAFCGLAQDPTQLIIARALQGVGGALMSPQPMAIITSIFPPERRGAAFAIPGILGGLAVAAGPIVGGFLITNFGWPSIFYVNVPVGVVALTLATLVVPDIRPGRRHRLDMLGVLLATAGVLGITFGLIEGERYNWGGVFSFVSIPQIIGAGVLLMLVFLATQYLRQDREPLLPFELFKDRNYSLMTLVAAAMGFAMLGLFLPLTIYLQSVLGLSALQAGLTVLPQALVIDVRSRSCRLPVRSCRRQVRPGGRTRTVRRQHGLPGLDGASGLRAVELPAGADPHGGGPGAHLGSNVQPGHARRRAPDSRRRSRRHRDHPGAGRRHRRGRRRSLPAEPPRRRPARAGNRARRRATSAVPLPLRGRLFRYRRGWPRGWG